MKLQRYDAEKVECDVCLSYDVEQLEARLERAEQLNAELLSAAKGLVRWWDTPIDLGPISRIDRLRDAIAKAEGENHGY